MKRILSLGMCLAMVAAAGMAFAATNGAVDRDLSELQIAVQGEGVVLNSASSSLNLRKASGPDTFTLYGGAGTTDGKFQDANGVVPVMAPWTGVDITDNPIFWHTDTFNAANLNSNGPGNVAFWCGLDAASTAGWASPGGYGNGWFDVLLYESAPLGDPSIGQVVSLDFFYNHDTEPGYDYFIVQYDSAGTWTELLAADFSNKDTNNVFQAPGVQYSTSPANNGHGIVYTGNDYDALDRIAIRMIVSSDGGWSDQDGLWPTHAGAVQVDDIALTSSNDSFVQDHDVVTGHFVPDKAPFAGNFADVYAQFSDIDPCIDNGSPVVGFIDYGQAPDNGPGTTGLVSTGGSSSANWSYGINTGNVVNYTDGISGGGVAVTNEVWSGPISWDPGVAMVDTAEVVGALHAFSVYRHLPLLNGIFYVWHVRSRQLGGDWSAWQDRNFVYYGGGVAGWANFTTVVTDLLLSDPADVELAYGVIDYAAVFGFPGTDATPSPIFDNIRFDRYRIGGPAFSTRQIDLSNDGFPASGTLDVSTELGRGALDIAFDMARDVNTGDVVNTMGDSIICDVVSSIPGATVTDIRMKWALKTNSVFEDALRAAPARAKDVAVVAGAAGTVWTGEVVHDTTKTSAGAVIADRFFFDLPDVDFMYPGDELHYYIEATDSDGRTTTFPGNLAGFGLFDGTYNGGFTNRGLPSISSIAGAQPSMLVWNDFGRRGGENDFYTSLSALGFAVGADYDVYNTNGPSSGVSNGLGASGQHGASTIQIAGYNTILYFSGNLSATLMSDGSNAGGNDKGNDLGLLLAWNALPGDRHIAYFGDYVSSTVSAESPTTGATYVSNNMGVILNDADVRDEIDNQTAPVVRPVHAAFTTEYVAYGGCGTINQFDSIAPSASAVAGHGYVDLTNAIYAGPQASVVYDRLSGVDRKVDVTFSHSMMYIYNKTARTLVGNSARTKVFEELFGLFGVAVPGGSPITGVQGRKVAELSINPNPFNPSTLVKFSGVAGKKGSVKVFNLRGELVSTLFSGEFQQDFAQTWDGTDRRGASVASGVYVIQAVADGQKMTRKAALVK